MVGKASIAEFNRSIDKAVQKKVFDKFEKQFKDSVMDMWQFVTRQNFSVSQAGQGGSPAFTGRYSVSHNITLNAISTAVAAEKPKNEPPYGPLPAEKAAQVLARWKPGQTVFITNSLPYADELEFSNPSPKAPRGIYRVAEERFKIVFKQVQL